MPKTSFSHYVLESSIAKIKSNDWEQIVDGKNIYFSTDYLESLEKTMSDSIDFLYAVFYNEEERPIMIGVFQIVPFYYSRNCHPSKFLKHFTADKNGEMSMNILVCGNVFAAGENGFLWDNTVDDSEAIHQIADVMQRIKKDVKIRKKITVLLFKEFWPSNYEHSSLIKSQGYKDFMIDVNMVMPIHPSWKSFKDYLLNVKAKFRTKANGVFKKSSGLVLKDLNHEEIIEQQDRIKELFNNVVEKSNYRFGTINPLTFGAFKQTLGKSFSFRGVFYEGLMIGFSTSFFHKGIMEANFVGLDYTYNVELGVYQRLLYDYVEQAIINEVTELQLGRTSELIKSSLGARPVNMTLFAKHKAALPNFFMSSILSFVSPNEFELRQPYKSKFLEQWIR